MTEAEKDRRIKRLAAWFEEEIKIIEGKIERGEPLSERDEYFYQRYLGEK